MPGKPPLKNIHEFWPWAKSSLNVTFMPFIGDANIISLLTVEMPPPHEFKAAKNYWRFAVSLGLGFNFHLLPFL
jgi:hypothetical protein